MMTQPHDLRRPSAFRAMGRAFAYRNYRLFFLGQGISLIGTWMTRVATGWLVFRLSGSDPRARFRPSSSPHLRACWWTLEPLVVTQVLSLVQSALLAVVAFRGEPGMATIWQIVLLSVCQGIMSLARGLFHPAQGLRRTTENHAGCLVFYASECDRGRLHTSRDFLGRPGLALGGRPVFSRQIAIVHHMGF
jgi:hypothetical protein